MKNIIILVLLAISTATFAQSTRSGTFKAVTPAGTVKTYDTTVNTDTSYLWVLAGCVDGVDDGACEFWCHKGSSGHPWARRPRGRRRGELRRRGIGQLVGEK